MNHVQPILIAAACVLALSACASEYPVQRAHAPAAAAPANSGMIEPAAAEGSAYGATNTGGTYPYGTGQATGQVTTQGVPQQANAEVTEGVMVIGPDGTVWLRVEEEDPAYRGDMESCYAYARGQVEHDVRIESDVASAFDADEALFGMIALRERMNEFERGNRVPDLVSSCMSSKGYSRR
jgi:hypothetical protein